jgi:hypothetical protein
MAAVAYSRFGNTTMLPPVPLAEQILCVALAMHSMATARSNSTLKWQPS